MGLNKKIFILMALVLLLTPCLASSGEHRVSPTGSTHDQNVINDAINAASASGGGTVYLAAGVYLVDGPVIIKSNITLTGDPDAIIRVAPTKNQWFQGQIGVVCNPNEAIQNVEIHGFQIDGNIKNLDRWLDSTPEHDRDCEKLILIGGWSSNMGSNISIHDMKLYDAFSDGIYIRFTDGVYLYDNTISNCQHEGFYLSACRYGLIILNQIAGITSDCGRLDNCQEFLIKSNLFFSYDGNSYGAYKHGENGLQIGNQGAASHGYTPTKKPFTTLNIEVTNNTFADPGLRAIWLSGGGQNVYVHDNQFKDASVLETMGIKVGDISFNNTTSIGTSEKVLGGLSRFFHIKFFDSGRTNQSAENIRMKIEERDNGKISAGVAIAGFKDVVYKDGVPYIPDSNSILVKSVAIPSPGFGFRVTGDLKKEIKTEIRDGKAYASLTITMNYFKESRNSKGQRSKNYTQLKKFSKPSRSQLLRSSLDLIN
jgi:parallel beta-helix repeat protein